MTPLEAFLTTLRKERKVIKDTRFSFAIVCVAAAGLIWYGIYSVYAGKIANVTQDRDHWKNESDYWQNQTKHPNPSANPLGFSMPSAAEQEAALREEHRLEDLYTKRHPGNLDKVAQIDWINEQLETEGIPLREYISNRPKPCPAGYTEIGQLQTDHVDNSVVLQKGQCFNLEKGKFTNGKNGIVPEDSLAHAKPQR